MQCVFVCVLRVTSYHSYCIGKVGEHSYLPFHGRREFGADRNSCFPPLSKLELWMELMDITNCQVVACVCTVTLTCFRINCITELYTHTTHEGL